MSELESSSAVPSGQPTLRVLLALQFLSGVLVAPLFALFPVYIEGRLGLTAEFSGNLRAFFVVTGGVMAVLGGAATDRLGRKRAYLLGMSGVLTSSLLFLAPEIPHWGFSEQREGVGLLRLLPSGVWMMGLVATYSGLTFGLGAVAGQSYLMAVAESRSLARATAGYFISATLGNAVGSAVAGEALQRLGVSWGFLGASMLGGQLLLILGAARWLPGRITGERSAGAALSEAGTHERGVGVPPMTVALLMGLRGLPTVYWGICTLLMPLLLFRATGSKAWAGNYMAASLVVSALCQGITGALVDRYGPARFLVLCVGGIAAAAFAQAHWVEHPWLLSAAGLAGAGAAWSLSVTMLTVVRGLAPPEGPNRLLGLTHAAWSAGFLTGTLVAGYLGKNPGDGARALQLGGWCAVTAALCAAGVSAALAARSKEEAPR